MDGVMYKRFSNQKLNKDISTKIKRWSLDNNFNGMCKWILFVEKDVVNLMVYIPDYILSPPPLIVPELIPLREEYNLDELVKINNIFPVFSLANWATHNRNAKDSYKLKG